MHPDPFDGEYGVDATFEIDREAGPFGDGGSPPRGEQLEGWVEVGTELMLPRPSEEQGDDRKP